MFSKKLQRFSIRKLSVGAVSVLIGMSFMAINDNNQVQAANIESNVNSKNVNNIQNDKNASSEKLKEAHNLLDNAKNAAAKATNDYNEQNSKIIVAQQHRNEKSQTLDKANVTLKNAQNEFDKSKEPDVLDAAKADIKNKSTDLDTVKDSLDNSKQEILIIENSIDKASKDVKDKQQALSNAQEIEVQKSNEARIAKETLNNVGLEKATVAHNEAVKNVEENKNELTQVNKDILNKTQEQKQIEDTMVNVQRKRDNLSEKIKTLQSDYDSKKADSDKANSIAQAKKNELDKLNEKLNYLKDMTKNTIVIPELDKYKKAFVHYVNNHTATQADIDYFKEAFSKNKFIHSDADKKINVEINNLTDDQLEETSLFAADLMGKARAYFGWPNDKVTKGSLTFARAVAKRHVDDQWLGHWHYGNAINDVAKEMGLVSNDRSDRNNVQYYEDRSDGAYSLPSIISMDRLKEDIYDSILQMIIPTGNGFDDPNQTVGSYEMAHASNLLGATVDGEEVVPINDERSQMEVQMEFTDYPIVKDTIKKAENLKNNMNMSSWGECDYGKNKIKYVAEHGNVNYYLNGKSISKENLLSFLDIQLNLIRQKRKNSIPRYVSAIPSNVTSGEGQYVIHEFMIDPKNILKGSTFSTEEIPSYAEQITKITTEISPINTAYLSLKKDADSKQSLTNTAKDTLNRAETALNQAQSNLDKAVEKNQSIINALNEAKQKVNNLTRSLNEAEHDEKAKQNNLDEVTKRYQEKKKVYDLAIVAHDEAKQKVRQAQDSLINAKNILTLSKQHQNNLKQEIKNKEQSLKAAQKKLNQAINYLNKLQEAPSILAKTKKLQKIAQDNFNEADNNLRFELVTLKKLKIIKDNANKNVLNAKKELDRAITKLEKAKQKIISSNKKANVSTKQKQERSNYKIISLKNSSQDIYLPKYPKAKKYLGNKWNSNKDIKNKKYAKDNKLPQTSTSNKLRVAIAGLLTTSLGLIGLAGSNKKRKN